jgi:hypothetical protein
MQEVGYSDVEPVEGAEDGSQGPQSGGPPADQPAFPAHCRLVPFPLPLLLFPLPIPVVLIQVVLIHAQKYSVDGLHSSTAIRFLIICQSASSNLASFRHFSASAPCWLQP